MLPYQNMAPKNHEFRSFGTMLEPRYIIGAKTLDQ